MSNHLGNVLVTTTDRRIQVSAAGVTVDSYAADIMTANDYYPYGMLMPGRKFTATSSYRYGFNGQEKSTEINVTDNLTTAEYWEYDSRIGRRWNVDPKPTIGISQYSAFTNNPVWFSDALGDSGSPIKPLIQNGNQLREHLQMDYQIQLKSSTERSKNNQKNAPPLITGTFAITKGTYGAKKKVLGVGVEYSTSENETDVFGVRDNKNVNKKEKEYRTGMSGSLGVSVPGIPIGAGGGSSLTITTKEPMKNGVIPSTAIIEKKTSVSIFASVTQTTAQGNTIYSGSQVEILGLKGGYFFGYDISLDINIPSNSPAAYPSFIGDNASDNTRVQINYPILKKK